MWLLAVRRLFRHRSPAFDYRATWKQLNQAKAIRAEHVIQYAILLALEKSHDIDAAAKLAIRRIAKAFTPVTRPSKLANGVEPLGALTRAVVLAHPYALDVLGQPNDVLDTKTRRLMVNVYHKVRQSMVEYYHRRYVYLFVRQDMRPEYQLVQTAHAALKMGHHLGDPDLHDVNPDQLYFTVIGVKDSYALVAVEHHLQQIGVKYSVFNEPDIGNEDTAIVTYPVLARERRSLLRYRLLRFGELG